MFVYITKDLMLGSRAKAVAQQGSKTLQIFPRLPAAEELDPSITLILVDLQTCSDELAEWLVSARTSVPEMQVIAYAPHVQTNLLEVGREAGVDQVLTRGQFDRALPTLLGA